MKTLPLSLTVFAVFTTLYIGHPSSLRADVVTPDDTIIQGSLAVGIDTVNNESFGFDTIRLKENNTRLSFNDTSSSAGFTSNDWTIEANSSASGGANYLGFRDKGTTGGDSGSEAGTMPFRIAAGAAEGALWVDSTSRVGLGTIAPSLRLHLAQGDTPAIRFEQTNGSGFTPQTWDVACNEVNFFIRDLTGGSLLPFRIRPGAPTSSIDIAATGNVGIGTAAPTAKLHVEGTAFISQTLEIGSSRTRKENIRDLTLTEAKQALIALQPVQFNYKTDTETQLGFIAEDVPDLVATQERKSLVPMDFVAVLTKVSQYHDEQVSSLEKRVQEQGAMISALEKRLAALEATAARPAMLEAGSSAGSQNINLAKGYSVEHAKRSDAAPQTGEASR